MRRLLCLAALLCLLPMHALAAKAPAVLSLGSEAAAQHLSTHTYAYTCSWSGEGPSLCPDPGCPEYGHVHCYGRRVSLWDTPAKGSSRVPYYPNGTSAMVGPDTQFQLVGVVSYKGKFYANLRVMDGDAVICSGFVNADYIGCDCAAYEGFEPLDEFVYDFSPFML